MGDVSPSIGRRLTSARAYLLAVVDQGLVSASNFITGILVAKAVVPAEFGQYTLLFAVIMALAGVHNALIYAPMRVNKPARDVTDYFRVQVSLQWLLSGILVLVSAPVMLMANVPATSVAIFALCLILIQTQETGRVIYQVRYDAARLLLLDGVVHGVRLTLLILLSQIGSLNAAGALAVIALASTIAVLVVWRDRLVTKPRLTAIRRVVADNWQYGRWILLEGVVSTFSVQIYLFLVALVLGSAAAGTYGALVNLANVVNVVTVGVMGMAIPRARAILKNSGAKAWRGWLLRLGMLLLAASTLALSIMTWFSDEILATLYTPYYAQYSYLMPILAVSYALMAVNTVMSAACYTSGRQQLGFYAKLVSLLVVVVGGYPLLRYSGLQGAMIGMLLTQMIWMVVYWYGLSRKRIETTQFSAELTS